MQEAECYQKIGHIYEKQGDLVQSIDFLNKFLKIAEDPENPMPAKQAEAHKQLAETHSKNGNVQEAIQHLEKLLNIANQERDKPA